MINKVQDILQGCSQKKLGSSYTHRSSEIVCKFWCLKLTKKKLRPIWADNLTHISGRSRYRKQTARVPLPKGTPHHEAEVNCFATKAQSKNGCQYMKHLIRGIHIIPYTTMYIHIYIYTWIYTSVAVCFGILMLNGWEVVFNSNQQKTWQSGKNKYHMNQH